MEEMEEVGQIDVSCISLLQAQALASYHVPCHGSLGLGGVWHHRPTHLPSRMNKKWKWMCKKAEGFNTTHATQAMNHGHTVNSLHRSFAPRWHLLRRAVCWARAHAAPGVEHKELPRPLRPVLRWGWGWWGCAGEAKVTNLYRAILKDSSESEKIKMARLTNDIIPIAWLTRQLAGFKSSEGNEWKTL